MTRYQDDFYDAINGEWQQTAEIPADKSQTGGFVDLDQEIEDLMLATTDKWLAGEEVPEDAILENFVKYHRLVRDFDKREADGITPVLPLLKEFQELETFADFTAKLAEFELAGKPNFLPFGVSPDFMDARINVLWASAPSTILPDTTYYAEEHPQQDFKKFAPALPLDDFFKAVIGQLPDKVIVDEERFWQAAEQFYSEEAWSLLKATLILSVVNLSTSYLTEDIRVLSGAYSRALSGVPEAKDKVKAAYHLAQEPFKQALGLWYAREKFSPEAKADVEKKVATMIDVYKERLLKNDWLTPETCKQAIVKLNVIKPYIGYPEELPARYKDKVVNETASLFENALAFARVEIKHSWSKWNQPVDYKEWGMPAHMVNAYYNPQKNLIVFPAAILQAPFYDLHQSSSANYGGIGAVIAHEISHAFDTNGASFDENGSLKDWWTESDYAAFKEKTQKVIDQFDGQDSYGATINGKLTVSENVADLGGIAAALEAAKREADFSAEEFFYNFGRIWRMKGRPEFMKLLASVDVHAPAKLRVNVQVPNFDDFFTTYDVKEGDGMWRSPEERVIIW
ncbi:endopeptidase [Streptococcus pneumoniae]|uniref:M13-type metalloendopeptidase n=1 Tax=Streptococcus pneumoniae TaxID=1313 RepID=UPI000778E5FB|nr:M13-type metalloendopeptidase [Streptococcus pneumoniae]KYB01565.1 endopeptidase [Streptococcus pneumoniae]